MKRLEYVTFAAIYFLMQHLSAQAQGEQRQQMIELNVSKWNDQFGQVRFSEENLFNCMVLLHPQPKSVFQTIQKEQLAPVLQEHRQLWFQKFFRDDFLKAITNSRPNGFYMNKGRLESSLLLTELVYDNNAVTVQESGNALLLVITPPQFSESFQCSDDQVGGVLHEWINLNKRSNPAWWKRDPVSGAYVIDYSSKERKNAGGANVWHGIAFTNRFESVAELLEDFGMPQRLKVGDVFTNRSQTKPYRATFWQEYVIGFISKQGICIILIKVDAPSNRAVTIKQDFDWLNRGLFSSDFKSLINAPKARSED